jgi:hypothetical protein
MAFFHSFTDSIRQKWLQFFQANRDWITLHMKVESVYTPDGGKRPSSYLILGVVNALEPKLAQLMLPFSKLNADADTLIEVLDLHFDPDIALGNSFIPKAEDDQVDAPIAMNENSENGYLTNSHSNGSASATSEEEFAIADHDSSASQNELGDLSSLNGNNSLEESLEEPSLEADDFGDISFETIAIEQKLDDELDDLNPPDENAFSDVLSDVWGDETALQKSDENNDFLGEELPAGVFDDSEIARLFPNN